MEWSFVKFVYRKHNTIIVPLHSEALFRLFRPKVGVYITNTTKTLSSYRSHFHYFFPTLQINEFIHIPFQRGWYQDVKRFFIIFSFALT